MSAEATVCIVEAPGVYDMPADTYHADPVPSGSLSASGARLLLPPSCPALYKYDRDHPAPPKRHYDLGHAAHKHVLGVGPELVAVDAEDWRTKAAREARDQAYNDGAVPLLAAEHEQVLTMAQALREHPVASALFDPDNGRPEQSLFWQDEPTGVWRRARPDWLRDPGNGRLIIPDYKTTVSASPDAIEKAIWNYGYCQAAPWYVDGALALGLAEDVAFIFCFQEKTPPYLITLVEIDAVAMQIGRGLNREAIDIYQDCVKADHWPGYSDGIELVGLPPWVERMYEGAGPWS